MSLRRSCLMGCFALVVICGNFNAQAADRTVKITTLDYLPYISEKNPLDGYGGAIVRAAFEAVGYKVTFEFYPWARAKRIASTEGYAGYWPAYDTDLDAGFVPSIPTHANPSVAVSMKIAPVKLKTVADLRGRTVCIVTGYSYGTEMDQMIKAKQFVVEESTDEKECIKKVIAGRADITINDEYTLAYAVGHDPEVREMFPKLYVQADFELKFDNLIMFQDHAAGRTLRDLFAQGMQKIDAKEIARDYVTRNLPRVR